MGDRPRLEIPWEFTTDLLELLKNLQIIKDYSTEMALTEKGDFIVTELKVVL